MSALPSKADMCIATDHVCFGPIADMRGLVLNERGRQLRGLFVSCQRQPGGEVRMLPQPTFLPLLHPGGTRPPFHPVFLPWLKPCGGPPPPPGPFAEAIVPVEAAKATDSATMVAIRGSDVRNFPSS